MESKKDILKKFKLFCTPAVGGIGNWLSEDTSPDIFERLGKISEDPLTAVQLNQLLVLGNEAPAGDDFFRYYWLETPTQHPYDVKKLPGFPRKFFNSNKDMIVSIVSIVSLDHLRWGLYRLYVDGLLYFGNVRTAYRYLRDLSHAELQNFFASKGFDTEAIKRRGPPLLLKPISKDDRYLIAEMACKSYGVDKGKELREYLMEMYDKHVANGIHQPKFQDLFEDKDPKVPVPEKYKNRQAEFKFSTEELWEKRISSKEDLRKKYERLVRKFDKAHKVAISNTNYYLSMLSDLDVYVATSMRNREDFRKMANSCDKIFNDEQLKKINIRYFDPTLSAARGHEDKGLIECLMVKCAKVLVYCAGEKESYGKDAEAAMALSLGKPVIFYCEGEQKGSFFRDVHPLSRLINFETGVAVGAMITANIKDVPKIILRLFENKMEYLLEAHEDRAGFLRLKEKLTNSVVRLQTNDPMLSEAFWNHYHRERDAKRKDTESI